MIHRTATQVLLAAAIVLLAARPVSGACTYSISPTTISAPAAGTSATVNITTQTGCSWMASLGVLWITVDATAGPPVGTGSGHITFVIQPNTSSSPRTGSALIGDQTLTVTQAGAATGCTYSISPPTASFAAGGGNGSVTVTAGSGCTWHSQSNASWITLSLNPSGSGNGTVTYSVGANTSSSPRQGTATIAGQTFTVNQAAAATGPAPTLGGVVNAADYTANFAPGMIISLFGSNFATATTLASTIPLPNSLSGASVEVLDGSNVLNAPLFFASPTQINAQLPVGMTSSSVQVRVRNAQGVSATQTILITPRSPRLFTQTMDGQGDAVILHADFTVVTANSPAAPGETLVLFLTGLGAVSPSIAAGQAGGDGSAGKPLNLVSTTVTVTVAGEAATVQWAGLAPYYVGLYQVNFSVPNDAASGAPEVRVSAEGRGSQAKVTFSSGGGWQVLTSANIGAAGGMAAAAGLTLTVPPGAFAGANAVRVVRNAAQAPEENQVGGTFGLSGLPATTSAPLTVSVDVPGAAPDPDMTYLVVGPASAGGGPLFLKATVQGNRVTAALPVRTQGLRAQAVAPSREIPAAATQPDLSDLVLLYVLTSVDRVQSPNGSLLFLFGTKLNIHNKAVQLAQMVDPAGSTLDSFMAQTGFATPWKAAKPVLVYLTSKVQVSSGSPGESADATQNGAAIRESLVWDGWSELDVCLWQLDRSYSDLGTTLQHELGYVVQDLAASPSQAELDGTDTTWAGAQVAIAMALDCYRSPNTRPAACSPSSDSLSISVLSNLAAIGFGYTGASGWLYGTEIGTAESAFLVWAAKNYALAEGWSILGDIATQRGTGANRLLPVAAINKVFKSLGLDVGDAWVEFWKYVAIQVGTNAFGQMANAPSSSASLIAFSATDTYHSLVWRESTDLTMKAYEVDCPVPWPSGAQRGVLISASTAGGGKAPTVVLHPTADGKLQVVGSGPSLTFNIGQDLPNNGRFYIMVINPNAVAPYHNLADITLSVSVLGLAVPTIGVTPASLAFTATVGSTPACQSLAISNTGSAGSTLTWSATVQTGASWLTLPGTYSGTNSGTVSVGINTAGLAAGNYTGSIRISAAGASNTPVNVPVTLTVSSPPSGSAILYFSLEIDHVAFTCNASSSDCAQSGNEFLTSSLNPFDNGKSASLVWNGSSFSLDTTYTVSGAPGYPYRVVLTGSVSSDGMTLGTTRITWTYTYGSHDSDITDVTIDQIPLTTSSNGRSTGGWVSTAAFQANPGKYVKNATWTHTYSSGASPVVSQIDLARTAAAQQGSYPITVYLGPF